MDESKLVEDEAMSEGELSEDESMQESPNAKSPPKISIQFSKHPKNVREFAAKIRKIERKIMLGLLTDVEESKLRSSKYFSQRFEKLLNLSSNNKKCNLYKLVTSISLNEPMIEELQKKKGALPLRKKIQNKINSLGLREKNVQEKVSSGTLSQNDVDSFLRDMYFNVNFGEVVLDHPPNSQQAEEASLAPLQQTEDLLCDYCQQNSKKNQFGQPEDLLICKDCSNKAHPSCLSYSQELVEQIRSDSSWQCIDCKACSICDGTGDPDTLLFCDACDKGYHMQCHTPKLEQTPSGKWACATCISKGKSVTSTSSTKQVLVIDDNDGSVGSSNDTKDELPTPQSSDDTMIAVNSITTVSSMEVMPIVSAPRRAVDPTPSASLQSSKVATPPIISVKPSNFVYHPSGLTYAPLPPGSSAVTLPPGHHPVSMPQPQFIPVNYMLPNGVPAAHQPPHGVPVQASRGVTPMIQPPPAHVVGTAPIPNQPTAAVAPQTQSVMGKGVRNDLSHILNPKVPLPDVRSSIRDDVLRALPTDVADWTVQNVAYYFKAHGYIHESKLLEEQEIDGRAMLLMSRNDCLTGLRIKLGPALKIYHMHIHKLQKKTDFLG